MEKQIDFITDLLTNFDEMGFGPTVPCPDPEAYAVEWKRKITEAFEKVCAQSEGEWISVEGDVIFKCSICDAEISTSWDYENEDMWGFCPCCGANMKGGTEIVYTPVADVVPRSEFARDLEALEKTVTEIYNRYVFEDNDYAEDDVAIEAVMNALTDVSNAIYELKEKYTKGGEG